MPGSCSPAINGAQACVIGSQQKLAGEASPPDDAGLRLPAAAGGGIGEGLRRDGGARGAGAAAGSDSGGGAHPERGDGRVEIEKLLSVWFIRLKAESVDEVGDRLEPGTREGPVCPVVGISHFWFKMSPFLHA